MAVCHVDRRGWTEVDDISTLSELRLESTNLLWAEADVADLSPADVAVIAEEFDLHPLAVEDAMETRQRPKLEDYGSHLFAVLHQLDYEDEQLAPRQIACFVGKRFVVTIHEGAERTLAEAKRRWDQVELERKHPSYLLHTLVDVVVDDYQRIADGLEDEIEELEETVLETPRAPIQRDLYSLKQRLARLRRYVLPSVRVLDWVVDPDSRKPFSDESSALFRDVHDHLMRISDEIRTVDDLAKAVLDLTQAARAEDLNEVSRKLTAWAAIFAVGTLIAGVYGMNFELVPEDQTLFGFWFAVALMVGCGIALYSFFKRRGWL